jgi:hypothetical protein
MSIKLDIKRVDLYPRAISEQDGLIVTSWNRLSDKKPPEGARCNVAIVAKEFSAPPEEMTWRDGAFRHPYGTLFSDPEYTFWEALK